MENNDKSSIGQISVETVTRLFQVDEFLEDLFVMLKKPLIFFTYLFFSDFRKQHK
jgi:hypothetical protein